MVIPFLAEAARTCGSGGCSSASAASGCKTRSSSAKRGGCCRKFWIVHPRPEFNPPEDIATLPEREQQKFVKMFRLVPDPVKVKSTQNYTGRMAFMHSPQYVAITNKLAAKLARSAKMLAAEPSVAAEEVMKMCNDTIIYGRSLIMGSVGSVSLAGLAEKYRFKNAGRTVERLDDTRNFRHGLMEGYPHGEPECRDFETLARTVNPSQWQTFLDRVKVLCDKYGKSPAAGKGVSKTQLYDRYADPSGRPLPSDLGTLPNRERLRLSKCLNCLPVQVLAVANQDYSKRHAYMASPRYAEERSRLCARLAKAGAHLAADPAVTPSDVIRICDEVVRFGRPLVFGEMRDVSLSSLAARYGFRNVERFIVIVEDEKHANRGLADTYPARNPEYADFDKLANAAYADRWRRFRKRLSDLNGLFARKMAQRQRR